MRKYLDIPITLIVTLILTVAMLWPLETPPRAPDGSDKVAHLIAFTALSFPLARTGRFGLIPVFVGASVFGGLIEIIQPTFNRSADMNDWVADVMGVVLGIMSGLIYRLHPLSSFRELRISSCERRNSSQAFASPPAR